MFFFLLILAGSDSDDNSDNVSQRSTIHTSRQQLNLSQPQSTQQQTSPGSKPCPYNFLVQLGKLELLFFVFKAKV